MPWSYQLFHALEKHRYFVLVVAIRRCWCCCQVVFDNVTRNKSELFQRFIMVVSGLLVILVQLNVCLQIVPGLILFVMISRKSCQDWNIVMVKLIVLMVLMSLLLVVSNQPFYPLVEAVICCFVYIYVFYFNVVRFNYVVYTESTNWIIIHFCCRLLPQ